MRYVKIIGPSDSEYLGVIALVIETTELEHYPEIPGRPGEYDIVETPGLVLSFADHGRGNGGDPTLVTIALPVGWVTDDLYAEVQPDTGRCGKCGRGVIEPSETCGVGVCTECNNHKGFRFLCQDGETICVRLARCSCGWAADGGDGAQQLVEMGETL